MTVCGGGSQSVCHPVQLSEIQLNWLIYVNIQSRAVLPNLGLKQQVYRGSFGRLHFAKLEALLETKTRQTEALFARHIVEYDNDAFDRERQSLF